MKKTFTLLALLISSIVHAQIPTDGLFAYYPMNNNGNDSAGTMHGTIMNVTPTTDRFGLNNKAYYFNGSSAYIALGSDPFAWRINNAEGVTVSAWVKSDATFGEGLAAVFARWNNSTTHDDYGCFLMQGTGNQLFAVNGVNNNGVQGSVGVNDNEWHHVLYSYSRLTGVTTMYVDGLQAYQQTLGTNPTSPSTNSSVRIGAQSSSSGQNAPHIRYFKGSMDDVRMYKRPFTAQEVTDLYSAELASPDCQAVVVNQHPQGAGICAGTSSATLSVAVAEPTATIQWQFNDGNGWGDMTGEMGLTVEAAAAGQYRAKVTADCGTISYSDAATVASGGPSFVEPMPTQAWLCSDQPHVLLTANAVGDGITYQWRRNESGQERIGAAKQQPDRYSWCNGQHS